MTTSTPKKTLNNLFENLRDLSSEMPETIKSFYDLGSHIFKEGQDTKKHKHQIALAIAIILKSHECIAYHMKILMAEGFTKQELVEVVEIIAYMGGGLGLASGLLALDYFDTLQ